MFRSLLTALIGLSFSYSAFAQTHRHLGTPAQQEAAKQWNRTFAAPQANTNWNVARPFSEVEPTGYVAISGNDAFELAGLREAIAKNLPIGVSMIIFVSNPQDVASLKKEYGKYLGPDRLKFLIVDSGADMVWGRDALPFPVHMKDGGFGLVNSLYPQDFEPDADFAKALSLPMVDTNQYFRGGNLLIDADANCYAENVNEVANLQDPQSYFKNYFGCASLTLLDQEGGIGDIDERLKFMGGKDVLTDDDAYASLLQAKGYAIHRIPTTGAAMETYMNTLYVNGTIFVPQMGIPADKDALAAYAALGMKPVGVYTKTMADDGSGNIHCVTMNYPVGSFTASVHGADFVEFAALKSANR